MHGHVSTFAGIMLVGKELVHKVLDCEASLLIHSCFAVLSKDRVIGGQSCC